MVLEVRSSTEAHPSRISLGGKTQKEYDPWMELRRRKTRPTPTLKKPSHRPLLPLNRRYSSSLRSDGWCWTEPRVAETHSFHPELQGTRKTKVSPVATSDRVRGVLEDLGTLGVLEVHGVQSDKRTKRGLVVIQNRHH